MIKKWCVIFISFTVLFASACRDSGTGSAEDQSAGEDKIKGSFTDLRDGKSYRSVKIGNQEWMAENLNFDTLDGTGSRCYHDEAENCTIYGRLYDWNTVMNGSNSSAASPNDIRGICPEGFHVPGNAEWDLLINFMEREISAAYDLRAVSGWEKNDYGTDRYGFAALPGGYNGGSSLFGEFQNIGYNGYWWTATEDESSYFATFRRIDFNYSRVMSEEKDKKNLYSLRCVKD